jgi:hypothetical protein
MNISPPPLPSYKPTRRVVKTTIVDYRPYISEGFYLSPDPYTKDFDPIGEIRIEVTPALVDRNSPKASKCICNGGVWEEVVTSDELLRAAVKQAIALQANAIVNLKITTEIDEDIEPTRKYIISGFCIVRK